MNTAERTQAARARAWDLLDRPLAWEALRLVLDASFGLYSRRISTLKCWGVLDGAPSVLDVGCGTGHYGTATTGPYLGVDKTARYIKRARRRWRDDPSREFRVADVSTLQSERQTFDVVLMVDLLHHLDDATCATLLQASAKLSHRYVVSLEPALEQRSPVGRWIVAHDRGDHIRPVSGYDELFAGSPLAIERSEQLVLGPIDTLAVLAHVIAAQDSHAVALDEQEGHH